LSRLGPDGHTDSDFLRSLRDRIRHDRVQANRRKGQRD
jgi:hypothetical protein